MEHLIRGLSLERLIDVTVLYGWDYRLGLPPISENISLIPVKIFRKSLYQSGLVGLIFYLVSAWFKIKALFAKTTFDLVHFHFSVPTGVLSLALPHGTPYVCSLHGIDVPGFVKEEAQLLQMLSAPLNRRVICGALAVFVPSNALKKALQRWEPKANVVVIPHGIDTTLFTPKQIYSPTCRRLVSVARLTKWKGHADLINAFSLLQPQHQDLSLDIYGDGEDRSQLERLIVELKLSASVRLCGSISHYELFQKMADYDLFVLPSTSEAFGLVFLEAMALGLPVIAADAGGPAEIVLSGETGLLCRAGDVTDLANKIEFMITNPEKAEYFGRNGRKRAEESYSWAEKVQKYTHVFQDNLLRKF